MRQLDALLRACRAGRVDERQHIVRGDCPPRRLEVEPVRRWETLEPGANDPEVLAQVAAVEKANGHLARVEQIKRWKLLDEEWIPGGDELTPTMKLKRRPIAEKYAADIEELYGR